MKRVVGVVLAGAFLTAGCASEPQSDGVRSQASAVVPRGINNSASPAAAGQQIIARINGQPVTMREVAEPLLASRGLALLLNIAQLDLAKQDAREAHVTVTSDDIRREQELTLDKMFPDAGQKEQDQLADAELKHQTEKANKLREQIRQDREGFLAQYLERQNLSRSEYDIVIELNAYLRKAAEVHLKGIITDDLIEKEFGLEYGETAKVRYIQLANLQEAQAAQRRLKAGEDFAQVARDMSRNALTAPLGGEMQPFSLQTQGVPQEFRQLTFSLQPGQVSDPLILGDNVYLIKLEQKFPPKAVKFADVKEALRKSMLEKLTDKVMNDLRGNLGTNVLRQLTIDDPLLAKQFNDFKAKREGAIKDRQKMNEQLQKERDAATQPTTAPATTMPSPATAPAPPSAPAATTPAAATAPKSE